MYRGWGLRYRCFVFVFLPKNVNCYSTILLERLYPLLSCYCPFVKNKLNPIFVKIYFWVSTLSHWFICVYVSASTTVLVTVAMCRLNLGNSDSSQYVLPQSILCLSRAFFLSLSQILNITLSMPMRNLTEISIEIVLNL